MKILLLDIYKNHENVNHYSSLRYKKGNGISDEYLKKIKKIICSIIQKKKQSLVNLNLKRLLVVKQVKIQEVVKVKVNGIYLMQFQNKENRKYS